MTNQVYFLKKDKVFFFSSLNYYTQKAYITAIYCSLLEKTIFLVLLKYYGPVYYKVLRHKYTVNNFYIQNISLILFFIIIKLLNVACPINSLHTLLQLTQDLIVFL